MKIFVCGSLSRVKKINKISKQFWIWCPNDICRNPFWINTEESGEPNKAAKFDSVLEAKKRAIRNLLWADKVIIVRKLDGTLGESSNFELAYCIETGKDYEIED